MHVSKCRKELAKHQKTLQNKNRLKISAHLSYFCFWNTGHVSRELILFTILLNAIYQIYNINAERWVWSCSLLMQQRLLPILQLKQRSLPGLRTDQEEHHNIVPLQSLVHKHPEEQHWLQSTIVKEEISSRKYNSTLRKVGVKRHTKLIKWAEGAKQFPSIS